MVAQQADKLRSVNVKMTADMIRAMDREEPNRSALARRICAAILSALEAGAIAPLEEAINAALRSSSRVQKMTRTTGVVWLKAIIWIPQRMHDRLAREAESYGIRPADFIRGAIIGYTGVDPVPDIVTEGHELWSSEAQDESGRKDY